MDKQQLHQELLQCTQKIKNLSDDMKYGDSNYTISPMKHVKELNKYRERRAEIIQLLKKENTQPVNELTKTMKRSQLKQLIQETINEIGEMEFTPNVSPPNSVKRPNYPLTNKMMDSNGGKLNYQKYIDFCRSLEGILHDTTIALEKYRGQIANDGKSGYAEDSLKKFNEFKSSVK
jgi:hypothetical protein